MTIIGRFRKISHAVNTATRLVDVFVNLPSSAEFLLGEYIQGKIAFDWSEDMVAALLQVQSAIGQALPGLPQGTTFDVRRMDPTVFPVLAYSVTSDSHSLVELRDIALYQLRPLLSAINGVAKIEVLGGAEREYEVDVDPDRLASYGLSLGDVAKALSAANVIQAVGRMEDHYKLYLVVSDTRFLNPGEIRNTILS